MINKKRRSARRRGWPIVGGAMLPLLFVVGTSLPARGQTAVWIGPGGVGGNGNWSNNAAWSTGSAPNSATAVVQIDNGNLASSTVTLDMGATVQSVTIDAGDGLYFASGGLSGGTINNSGTLQFNGSGLNYLSGMTVNGSMDLASSYGFLTVNNGLTLNGTASLNSNSVLAFTSTETLDGTGSIVFGNTGASNRINIEGNSTLTVGANMTIDGQNGTIGGQNISSGTANLINNGTISADVSGGSINLAPTNGSVTNNNILSAQNGGQLVLSSTVTNNGNINVGAGSNILQNGVSISGGIINVASGGSFTMTGTSANQLSGVTINGNTDMATAYSVETVANGLTNNGNIALNSNSVLAFVGNQTLGGTGSVTFGATGASNRINIEGNTTLTVGAGEMIHGQNGTIGQQFLVSGTANLVNNGTISADVSGGSINIGLSGGGTLTNNNILSAQNGGQLVLSSYVANGSGNINVGAGSNVFQNSVTINGGTINVASGGSFTMTGSNSNQLSGVTINGNTDMASGYSVETVTNGLTNNGNIAINSNSYLAFIGDQTLGGAGSVTFGATGSSNRLNIEGNTTLTVGSGEMIHGQNGSIGQQAIVSGTANLINNGTISADVSGGSINIGLSGNGTLTNNNILSAQNGGQLVLSSNVTNNANINANAGSNVTQNGVTITGGTINVNATGSFTPTNSSSNFLSSVTINGNVDMATNTSVERVINGLTLNSSGNVAINSNSNLAFQGDQTLGGTGSVTFGSTGSSNRLNIEGNTTLTIGSGIEIHGQNGSIGQQAFIGGTANLINNGTISADVAGGTIYLGLSGGGTVTNNNVLSAANGGQLFLNSNITNNADINVGNASNIAQNGVQISGSNINVTAGGSFTPANSASNFLSGVTVNGEIDMSTATGVERVLSGMTLNGNVAINSNSVLAFQGDQTLGGTGTVTFGATSASNRLAIDGNTTLTIGSGITVHGQTGTIGAATFIGGTAYLVNNGTISADAGGTISVVPSNGVTNNAEMSGKNGGQLVLNSNVTNSATGHIDAKDGTGSVFQNGVTISGGTINGASSVISGAGFAPSNSTGNVLSGVTVTGTVDMATNAGIERVVGGLTLGNGSPGSTGTVAVNSNSVLSFVGDQTLGGTGSVVLGSTGAGNRVALDGNTTLTIDTGVSMHGINGTIGGVVFLGGTGNLINNGTIGQDGGGGLINVNPSGALTNNGTLSVAAGGTLNLTTGFTNYNGGTSTLTGGSYLVSGTLAFYGAQISTNAATIVMNGPGSSIINLSNNSDALTNFSLNAATGNFTVSGGKALVVSGDFANAGHLAVAASSSFQVNPSGTGTLTSSGLLTGAGTIIGNVVNSGVVQPGDSPGTLTVTGTYTQTGAGTLQVLLASTGYDVLATGSSLLAGTLNVMLSPGFLPYDGETFTILTSSNTQSGTFGTMNGLTFAGGFFDVFFDLQDVRLVAHVSSINTVPEPSPLLMAVVGIVLGAGVWYYRGRVC